MPNRLSPSTMAATVLRFTGFSTIENRPEAPVKSRFHKSYPGSVGSADLAYLPDSKTLLVPMMLNNSLLAYTLD